MAKPITTYRTASFKLHNLSRRKRDIIEHAFTEYTIGYFASCLSSCHCCTAYR
jgi:hypothetical protein